MPNPNGFRDVGAIKITDDISLRPLKYTLMPGLRYMCPYQPLGTFIHMGISILGYWILLWYILRYGALLRLEWWAFSSLI